MACYSGKIILVSLASKVYLRPLSAMVEQHALAGRLTLQNKTAGNIAQHTSNAVINQKISTGCFSSKQLKGTINAKSGISGAITQSKPTGDISLSNKLNASLQQIFVKGVISSNNDIKAKINISQMEVTFALICPINLISSAFGGGLWIESYPWIETDAYIENP